MALTLLPARSIRHIFHSTRHTTSYHHGYGTSTGHTSGGGLVFGLVVLGVIVVVAVAVKAAASRG